MTAYHALSPVIIVTGFLGSGKTTLLNHLLKDPSLGDAAVLINEFGEVGLDHHLLEVIDRNTVLLASGCICCTIRDDLKSAVLELHARRARGEIPAFQRVIIETTGLADPTPIIATFMHDLELRHRYRLALVITTVDVVNGLQQLAEHTESAKQVAVADRIVLTKCDLAPPSALEHLRTRLTEINSTAEFMVARGGIVEVRALLQGDMYRPQNRSTEVAQWFANEATHAAHQHELDRNRHNARIHSFCVIVGKPLEWSAFGIWLTMLLHCHGSNVLRVKGLLNVRGAATPVVINGVQHLVHPPVHLAEWPDTDRRSRIVFIVQNLTQAQIEESLAAFNQLDCDEAVA